MAITDICPTPELIERAAAAAWNRHANIPWDKIPEDWKPFYRENAIAALQELVEENFHLRHAIETVLADSESQHPGGWGPDVTMVAVLREVLK